MNTPKPQSKLTALIAQKRKIKPTKQIIAPVVLTAMMFTLVAFTGKQSSVSAGGPNGLESADMAADDIFDEPCAGRMTETYYEAPPSVWPSLPFGICDQDSGGNCAKVHLRAYLYLPHGSNIAHSPKSLPVIVYNHGSGKTVNQVCLMARYFTNRGFAFFIPGRRGHRLPTDTTHYQSNTGRYWDDYLDLMCPGRDDQHRYGLCGRVQEHALLLRYLQDQSFEMRKAIAYLRSLRNSSGAPVIDPNKIAIMGHSFGGMVTLFNNADLTDHKAAIDIAGASESWDAYDLDDGNQTPDSSPAISMLADAVRGANRPLFFFEPKNDVSTRPTVVLSTVAGNHQERYQAALYPPVPDVADTKDAHVKFVLNADQIRLWGPAVIEFLARYDVK